MVEIEELPEDTSSASQLRQRKGDADGSGIDLSNGAGGLLKKILQEGTGEVCGENKRVAVHYTGKFPDGKVFDSSISRGRPLEFTVGHRNVILGWDVGIASMKKGEKAILTCKPDYAYGSAGAGNVIPPNSTLVFEVELVDILPGGQAFTPSMYYVLFIIAMVAYFLFTMQNNGTGHIAAGKNSP